jgi:hypothetical protein
MATRELRHGAAGAPVAVLALAIPAGGEQAAWHVELDEGDDRREREKQNQPAVRRLVDAPGPSRMAPISNALSNNRMPANAQAAEKMASTTACDRDISRSSSPATTHSIVCFNAPAPSAFHYDAVQMVKT